MDDLIRSSQALNSTSDFYDGASIIYVEGDTDYIILPYILNSLGIHNFVLKPCGGKEQAQIYARRIIDENAKIIVFMDSDYYIFDSRNLNHKRIVLTPGHSIENSLYSPELVSKLICSKIRSSKDFSQHFEEWRGDEIKKLESLMVVDIVNEIEGMGQKIIDKNFDQFTTSNRSCKICEDRVKKRLAELNFAPEISSSYIKVSKKLKSLAHYKFIRGHFYEKAVRAYILLTASNNTARKISMSDDEMLEKSLLILEKSPDIIEDYDSIKQSLLKALHDLELAS